MNFASPSGRLLAALVAICSIALAACGGGIQGREAGNPPLPVPVAGVTATPSPAASGAAPTPTASARPGVTPTPTPAPVPTPTPLPGSVASVGGCAIFPPDNPWNTDISAMPADPNSANYMAFMDPSNAIHVHPDFGSDPSYGIPYSVVNPPAPSTLATFTFGYPTESDPGPYPIPPAPLIEAGSDAHMLVVDAKTCKLYETFATSLSPTFTAGSGAIFPLNTNNLRPDGWTSADAAGLPILPGLARYDETAAGAIYHALRFTVPHTSAGYIHPATHFASTSSAPFAPPMGLRLRVKASFDISSFSGESLVILKALKRYGMFLADNGSSFYISGSTDTRWNDNDLNALKTVPSSAFEVVKMGTVIH